MSQVEIKGLRELRTALVSTIPANMQGKVLQKALAAGTALTVRQARANAPRKTGRLARAIYAARSKFDSKPTLESRVVGVRRGKKYQKSNKDAYYWKFVEFGHRIGTRKSGYLAKEHGRSQLERFRGAGGESRGFVPARPFLRPAFEATKQRASLAIRDRLAELLKQAAKRASWR